MIGASPSPASFSITQADGSNRLHWQL